MPSVVYLVDYENVHERGLYGMRMLLPDDQVYIIYTDNADKISLDCVSDLDISLHAINVPTGKQSLDMHLASMLGYMIGQEKDKETCYIIVSNDTDFDGIIRYWSNRFETQNKVSRRCTISEDASWIAPQMTNESVYVDDAVLATSDHKVLCQAIRTAIEKAGATDPWSIPRIDFSKLCSILNSMPEYARERQRSGKKPQQLFKEEYADQIWIGEDRKTTYAYLVKHSESHINEEGVSASPPGNESPDCTESVVVDDEKSANLIEDSAPNCSEHQPLEELLHSEPSLPYADIATELMSGGMNREQASLLAPIVLEAESSGNTKSFLYNVLRKSFGGTIGARYYREVRDMLNL